jgi:hypothetical protein
VYFHFFKLHKIFVLLNYATQPTMTLFSAAAAAALERFDEGPQPGLYSYSVELEFTVKTNRKFAPSIVVKILAQLMLEEPDVVFVDPNGDRIMIDDFPQSKDEFDEIFSTTTDSGRLSCTFKIHSSKNSFHAIKISVWAILQEAQVWFKKAPRPVQKTPLTAIRFWMNVHPGFWNSRVFHSQMMLDVEQQYAKHPAVIEEFRLPTDHMPVEMYSATVKSPTILRKEILKRSLYGCFYGLCSPRQG